MNSKSSVTDASKKHRRDSENESDENDDLDPVAFAQMTRSQRKCHRERRRRSEVNKGFDDLTSLLWDIDASTMRAEIENRSQRGKKQSNLPTEDVILSRVDLINCTISLIRRLHAENEQRKDIISTLTRTSTGAFDNCANLALPNLGNMTAARDNDRTRLASTEGLLLGMISPNTVSNTYQGDRLSVPSGSLDSNNIFQRQALLEQLARTQPDNSGVLSRSIQDVLNSVYSPQSAMTTNRKDTDGLAAINMRTGMPSSAGDIDSGINNESVLLQGPSNSDVVATFLARQQHNRNVSNFLNNTPSNSFGGNLASPERAALPMRSALPVPASVASTDSTQQLLQLLQNRQMNSASTINLSQIEALLQQQLQQKPHGR